jgi:NAD(P)-dependent dehydrogenase (short-subunit alcohol dehydrogenase family)
LSRRGAALRRDRSASCEASSPWPYRYSAGCPGNAPDQQAASLESRPRTGADDRRQLDGVFCSQSAAQMVSQGRGGCIVNIIDRRRSGVSPLFTVRPKRAQMLETSPQWARYGIRVNAVGPRTPRRR